MTSGFVGSDVEDDLGASFLSRSSAMFSTSRGLGQVVHDAVEQELDALVLVAPSRIMTGVHLSAIVDVAERTCGSAPG